MDDGLFGEAVPMADLLYILGSVAFFGLMMAYVRACEALGRGQGDERGDQ
jgi:hypothetical protein